MALATQHFDLYIIPNTTPPPVLDISQYDTSRTFIGHVKDIHGKPYSLPNNTTALLEGRNGNGIIFRLNVVVNGDTLTFTPDEILTDTSGRIHATISLDSTGQYLSPLRIIFNVQCAGITKEERTTNPDFRDAVAAAFQAYIDKHGSGGGGGSGEMNVQSDWNQGNINADDYIKNKPTKLSQFQNDSGFITSGQIPTELPTVTSSDNGKVLGVSNGVWNKVTPSSESGVPTGGSVGQVLTKTSSGSIWSDVPAELPSGGSTGQVLKKTSSGVAWQNESSGSSITVDSALSTTSTNPVQNKVITNAINAKGTYSKPSGGIPKTDLASAVQTSLGKADTALQTPSSYSNGQVLMVQNGSWVASNPPTELPSDGSVGQVLKKTQSGIAWQNESGGSGSGSDMFVLHLTGNTTSGYQITESAADIMAHYPNIILIYEDGFTDEYYLAGARLDEEAMWGYLWFAHDENWVTDGTVSRYFVDLSLSWDTENPNYGVSAYRSSTTLRKLPQASNAQNDKVLGVVGGNYTFVNMATNTLFYVDGTTVKSAATNLACTGQDIINATVAKGAVPTIKFTENYIDYYFYLDNTWSAGPTFKTLDGLRNLEMAWDSSTVYINNQ